MTAPNMAVNEFGPDAEGEEFFHKRLRFGFRQSSKANRMTLIDIKRLAARIGMGPDDRVGDFT